jgi:prepilin-type N-terminal cleavage/methylation domain-containing protein
MLNKITDIFSGYKKQMGFTLAEILITLLIVGVISSLVIPGIIADSQQAELKISWKKAYGSIMQTYKLAVQEDPTAFSGYNCYDGSGWKIYNALKNTMGYVKECNSSIFGNCWAGSGVGPDSSVGGGCPGFNLSQQNTNTAFVARDGTFWLIYQNGGPTCPIMAVDINGNKGPNQWNKDVLSFSASNGRINLGSCTITPNSTNYLK